MEEEDRVTLHYRMLEYLFSEKRLATSCYNYTWDKFLRKYPEYGDSLTPLQLKREFWEEVAVNITEYELLTEDQKEYFDRDDLVLDVTDENLSQILINNEPKKDVDYRYHKSLRNTEQNNYTFARSKNVRQMYREPLMSDQSDILLDIFPDKLPMDELESDSGFKLQSLVFLLLNESDRAADITSLTDEEILERLRNPNILPSLESTGPYRELLQKITDEMFGTATAVRNEEVEQAPVSNLKSPLNANSDTRDSSLISSLPSIPSILSLSHSSPSISHSSVIRTPTRSVTRSLSQQNTTSSRRIALEKSKSITPSRSKRNLRARQILVPVPSLNPSMDRFMKKFDSKN